MNSAINYAARLTLLLSKIGYDSHPVENGWEIPEHPARYLAIETADEPLWAMNSETLKVMAVEIDASDTQRTAVTVWDLDTGRQYAPITQTTGFFCLTQGVLETINVADAASATTPADHGILAEQQANFEAAGITPAMLDAAAQYSEADEVADAAPANTTDHQLLVFSLQDGQASCSCGGWSFTSTGKVTREHVEAEHSLHVRQFAATPNPAPADLIAGIAKTQLGIETLETRNSDRLDFHEVAVWQVKAALETAYRHGAPTAPPAPARPCEHIPRNQGVMQTVCERCGAELFYNAANDTWKALDDCAHETVEWDPIETQYQADGTALPWQEGTCCECGRRVQLDYQPQSPHIVNE
jgi:hypothetical protein